MTLTEKECCSIEEAAELSKYTVHELIHFGANCLLKIGARINFGDSFRIEAENGSYKGWAYNGLCCWLCEDDLSVLDTSFDRGNVTIDGFYPHPSEFEDLIHWNNGFREQMKRDDLAGRLYFIDAEYTVHCNDLFVMREDLQGFIQNHPAPTAASDLVGRPVIKEKTNKGGKPKGALSEAVEHAYMVLIEKQDIGCLRAGNIEDFFARLKEMASEGNKNADEYVLERIKEVKTPISGKYTVTTQSIDKIFAHHKSTTLSRIYQKNSVSKLLTEFRNKFPLPT